MRDLQEFLQDADLSHYYAGLTGRLKVTTLDHLKYVQEDDLEAIGMSRPEMRRLKKFYKKEFPQGTFNKLRKAILRGGGDGSGRPMSPSPPQQRGSRAQSVGSPYKRPPGRQLIPSDSVVMSQVLGQGEFGLVQQAVWTTETGEKVPVAVKRLTRDRLTNGTQTFLKEAAIMQELDHEHIVHMYGVVLDQEEDIMMVTELAPMRSLLECLKDPALRTDLTVPRLCDFAQQVCDGMGYLENKRLVHRDLAARNILVFSKSQVKISDLGLSRILGVGQDYYQSTQSASLKLPVAWCAPECINFLKFTSASDVWSFGVALWEFFTYGVQPWAGMNGQQILEAIDEPNLQRLAQPELCTPEYYDLMKECWKTDPEVRPTFGALGTRLPQLRPTLVKAIKDCPGTTAEKGYIMYKAGDVITVINKMPTTSSPPGMIWLGITGESSGLFDPTNVAPFIEPKVSPIAAKTVTLARKESGRKSGRKIRADMISRPQNDLRLTGHIGYDGAVFGDVSFIGDNFHKLPLRVDGGMSSHGVSMTSIPIIPESPDNRNGHVKASSSEDSLNKPGANGIGQSWMSRESLSSQATTQSETTDGRKSPSYLDVEDDSLFADFKMPELGSSFDFGPSFMDEVLKALDEKEKQVTSGSSMTPTAPEKAPETRFQPPKEPPKPPKPVPRESTKPAVPPLPSNPPRVDPPKEKKQAKVKPMSSKDEKMLESVINMTMELTSHQITGEAYSPPVSPGDKSRFFDDDSPGIMAKLKNSIRRSVSPKTERKRTFSDELESKGDVNDEVSPEAQQAYNILVVKGDSDDLHKRDLRNANDFSSADTKVHTDSVFSEPDIVRDSKRISGTGVTISAPIAISAPQPAARQSPTPSPPVIAPKPYISAPQLQSKPVAITHPAPVPAPRPVKAEPPSKKSEIPVPKPRPEIQRVEPTIRQMVPESPELPAKGDRRLETNISISSSRKEGSSSSAKERDREDLKRTIEIVRVDDSNSLKDDASERASTSFDRSSARSSQRSSLDRSDAASENTEFERADWEHSEYSSDGSKPGKEDSRVNTSFGSGERQDSFSSKKQSSLFDDDMNEVSPHEVMSRLREKRLNRHLDHQRALAGEAECSSAVSTAPRPRPTAREPQGIPGRSISVEQDDGSKGDASDEVDTNPLRMLRGGAIPIRTGRGSAGTSSHGNPKALGVPSPNLSSHLSRPSAGPESPACQELSETSTSTSTPPQLAVAFEEKSKEPDVITATATNDVAPSTPDDAAAELTQELEKLTLTLMCGNMTSVATAVAGRETPAKEEVLKFAQAGHQMDLTEAVSEANASQATTYYTKTDGNTEPTPKMNSVLDEVVAKPMELEAKHSSPPPPSEPPTPLPPKPKLNHPNPVPTEEDNEVKPELPPRLPPRRSYSLSENPEIREDELFLDWSENPTYLLRRSSSLEEDVPPIPPRDPQPGASGVPLNSKPRERKYPLLFRPLNRIKPSSPRHISSTRGSPSPSSQQPPGRSRIHMQKSHSLSETSPRHTTRLPDIRNLQPLVPPTRSQSNITNTTNPDPEQPPPIPERVYPPSSVTSSPRLHNYPPPPVPSPSGHHHGFPQSPPRVTRVSPVSQPASVNLPPTNDLSVPEPDSPDETVDVEPTHMLLEPQRPAIPPALRVALPTSKDHSIKAEPTHVSLSWMASFPSGSPLSPPFQGNPDVGSRFRSDQPTSMTRSFDRSFGPKSPPAPLTQQYPNVPDNQSPVADLPPAPPAPSYRDKLKLVGSKPLVARSHSLNPDQSPPRSFGFGQSSSHSMDLTALHAPPNLTNRSHLYESTSPSSLQASKRPHQVFRYPGSTVDLDSELGDDDAFFSEAPSVPHPYSQSPFHPITTSNTTINSCITHTTADLSSSKTVTSQYSSSSSSTLAVHTNRPAPRPTFLSPFPNSTNPDDDAPPPISPRTTSRQKSSPPSSSLRLASKQTSEFRSSPPPVISPRNPTTQEALPSSPPPLSPRSSSHRVMEAMQKKASPSPPTLSPRSSSHLAMKNYALLAMSTTQAVPTAAVITTASDMTTSALLQLSSNSAPQTHQISQTSLPPSFHRTFSPSGLPKASYPPNSSTATAAAAAPAPSTVLVASSSSMKTTAPNLPPLQHPSNNSYAGDYQSEEVSPLMLTSYKNSSNVSYEDLLQFAADR